VTTHERELLQPVDLCTPDGSRLNPAARGWSRRPLHRANLDGRFGLNKRWDYWAVLAGDVVVSWTIADIDHLCLADVYWADLVTGEHGGQAIVVGAGEGIALPEIVGAVPLVADHQGLALRVADDAVGTTVSASWREPDGRAGHLALAIAQPAGHESMNVVIPWSDELFNFTSKQQARPATGSLSVGERRWTIGGPAGPEAWGVLDVGRGRWPSRITWNWGGGAGRSGDHVIGLQVGARWTAGTGFTENALLVDGRLSKLGHELEWTYDWNEPLAPWRVRDPGGQLDATLTPRFDKHTLSDVSEDLGSEVHQVFGTWAGRLGTDDGTALAFADLAGFAEEARQRW
jgi:hypothetical protein